MRKSTYNVQYILSHYQSLLNMGNKASRPARKLSNTIVNTDSISRSSKVQLPSQALKDHFENSEPSTKNSGKTPAHADTNHNILNASIPEGKDGTDPTADQAFIDSINKLGRQIHSHSAKNPSQQLDVTALKQLLNRKNLFEQGQKEVEAQLDALTKSRTMIHPRTLTGILNALNDKRTSRETIEKDYQVLDTFLDNLSRFKLAERVVVIEEHTKEDEIGPKLGQPVARAASESSMIDYEGEMGESVDNSRIKKLRQRLE